MGAKPKVFIAQGNSIPQFELAKTGIIETLGDQYDITVVTVEPDNIKEFVKQVRKERPKAIITIGTKTSKLVSKKVFMSPVIFCMALSPIKTGLIKSMKGSGLNVTGIALDIPPKEQFKKIKELFPWMYRFGVLYTPNQDEALMEEAKKAALELEIDLFAEPVFSQDQIQEKLELLFQKQINLLWATSDQKVYSRKALRYILLSLNRYKVPFMGLSSSYLKLGAFFSLDPDPKEVGADAAKLAIKIITEKRRGGKVPIQFPSKFTYSVSQKTVNKFRFTLPQTTWDNAQEIYK